LKRFTGLVSACLPIAWALKELLAQCNPFRGNTARHWCYYIQEHSVLVIKVFCKDSELESCMLLVNHMERKQKL